MTTLRNELIARAKTKEENQSKYKALTRAEYAALDDTYDFNWTDYNFTCLQAIEVKNNGGDIEIALSPLFKAIGLNRNNADDKVIIDAIISTPIATTRNGYIMTDETKAARKAAREMAKVNEIDFKDVYTETDTFKSSVIQTISVDTYRKAIETVIAMTLNNQAELIFNAENAKNEKIRKSIDKNIAKYERRYMAIVSEQPTLAREINHTDYNALKENVKQMYQELLAIRIANSLEQQAKEEEEETQE